MPTPIPEILRVSVIKLKSQPAISGTSTSKDVESIEIKTGVGRAGICLTPEVGVGVGDGDALLVAVGMGDEVGDSGLLNSFKLQDEMYFSKVNNSFESAVSEYLIFTVIQLYT